jgi:hypothetical protein
MIKFERRFLKYLNEADITDDQAAMRGMLDKDTDPSQFEVDVTPDESKQMSSAAETIARVQQQNNADEVEYLMGWITYLTEVSTKLNGLTPDSISSILAGAMPESILDSVKKEQDAIGRITGEIADLIQAFNTAVNKSGNPKLKNV